MKGRYEPERPEWVRGNAPAQVRRNLQTPCRGTDVARGPHGEGRGEGPGDPGLAAVRLAQAVRAAARWGGPAPQTLEEAVKENERLRSELIRMREREEALKKSLGILSETPERGMPRLRR